ncbi:MAG: hypothetical protein G01um101425_441 [Candidatus Peregrinibacteria bacterium Gr01-1014_25]|nr:MAG: hypothetical protein G01um101425_441 [Candidatus Peregrinibacteria bacterium Gr01-1014_25]
MLNSLSLASLQQPRWLAQEVDRRRSNSGRIRKAINDFAIHHRGVDDFAGRADRWMPSANGALTLCLARQIATVSLEHLCMELLERWLKPSLPVKAQIVEFRNDCFANNAYKQSLTSLPVLTHLRKDKASFRCVKVVPKDERSRLTSKSLLSSINARLTKQEWGVDFQGDLPGFHRALRRAAGLQNGSDFDISDFWSSCAREASRPPSSVFVDVGGKVERRATAPLHGNGYVRPPASWYYLLYLCLFVTGDRALVATTIEEDDESIRTLFLENIALIEEATGFAPLIVWLPHYSRRLNRVTGAPLDFTEIHPAVFQTGWDGRVTMPRDNATCYEAADHLLHEMALLPIPR